jgi:hypothetical protein
VEQRGAPEISVDIVGRNAIRQSFDQTFYFGFSNVGNVDAPPIPVWLLSSGDDDDFQFPSFDPSTTTLNPLRTPPAQWCGPMFL